MADELKIPVSAPGAQQAAQELRNVAAAEQQVAGAAQAAAPAVERGAAAAKGAAAAHGGLREEARTLSQGLRRLGPEANAAADAIVAIALRASPAAMAIGMVGAAIAGVTAIIGRFGEAQAEQKRAAEAYKAELLRQYEDYVRLAGAIEKVTLEEQKRRPTFGGQPPRAVVERITDMAGQVGLGKEGIAEVAQMVAAGDEPLTDEELRLMALWWMLGYGSGCRSPREARFRFRAQARGGAFRQRLDREYGQAAARAPEVVQRGRMEAAEAAAKIAGTRQGREVTSEEFQEDLQRRLERLREFEERARDPFHVGKYRPEIERELGELGHIARTHPGIGDIPFRRHWLGRYEAAPGGEGVTVNQVVYQGTTYVNVDGRDAAARPIESPAR